jgi:DNA-binding XRE family transcriptional regulator
VKTFPFDQVVAHDRERLAPAIENAQLEAVQEVIAFQLGELRKTIGVTQTQIAHMLGVSQPSISKLEHGRQETLPLLSGYIEALGGRLEIAAVFDEQRFVLRGLMGETTDQDA